jgi:dienelactone hydrolase
MSYCLVLTLSAALSVAAPSKFAAPKSYRPTAEELGQIGERTARLAAALESLAGKHVDPALLADVAVYHKAAVWIVRYAGEEFFAKRYVADTLAALDRGLARAEELAAGRPAWPKQKGQLVRAYRSRVDGSVQPYAVAIPDGYDGRKPVRLDVVLHGRGAALSEVNFIAAHDSPKPVPPEQDYIRLDVYGRWNNAYRWAGETDVFEAIASVRSRYAIDPRRIVLRGFSMGGAGTWHLGLHYPDQWAAVEAGAGFTDTKRYAKLEGLPDYQDAPLHIYDAVDYALNASNVPTVGYGGEQDAQLQATLNIRERLVDEGFHFTPDGMNWIGQDLNVLFLVGPKTGHKFHPESKQRSEQFIQAELARRAASPDHVRFVTYTTRYNRCFWLTVDGLEKHYARAEVDARRSADRRHVNLTTRNVAELVLADQAKTAKLIVDKTEISLPAGGQREVVLRKTPSGWALRSPSDSAAEGLSLRKRHGLQGPIDDALADSFLCVRPTGTPQYPLPAAYARGSLDTCVKEFDKWMRGTVRVKDDTQVTPSDIERHHLVLFGDPASNRLLARVADKLPIRWTNDAIQLGGQRYASSDHSLVMIYPNPLNPRRYVVLNSGHTFHERDFRGTNALLFARLGDYAVLHLTQAPVGRPDATVAAAGLFGERWELTAEK